MPGRFVTAEDVRPLIDVVDAAIGQRMRYWLERRNNVRVPATGFRDVSAGNDSLSWFLPGLPEGGYRLRVPTDQSIARPTAGGNGTSATLPPSPIWLPARSATNCKCRC